MTSSTHRIGIEVEAKNRGDGLRDLARQAKDLHEAIRKLDAETKRSNWDDYSREVAKVNRELHDYSQLAKKVEDSVREQFQAETRLEQATKDLAQTTARGSKEAFEYFQRYTKVVSTLNMGRYHTLEMAKSLGILKDETRAGGHEFHQYGTESEQFSQTVKALDTTIHTLNLSIKNLTDNLEKSERRMNQGEIAVDALGTEFQDTGERAYYLNQALFESEQNLHIWQNRAAAAEARAQALGLEMREAGNDIEAAGRDITEAAQDTNKLENELGDLARSVERVDNKLDDMSRSLDKVDDGLSDSEIKAEAWAEVYGNVISDVLEEAAQAAYQFAQDSVQAFYDFDRGTREIFTLIPGASADMREALKADVLALGTELGRLPDEMLPAVYNALSAGIPEENVLSAVQAASEAARAGVADLDTTLKLGVAVLNAQVKGVDTLDEVYDQLFFTIKNGVVTMPELTDGFNQVTSIAGEAGFSLQDISSALIVMTRQGDSAQEAFELLSIMMTQLSTSGTTLANVFEEAAGKSVRQFTAEGGTLAEAMAILQNHAENTGQALGDMLGGGSPFFRDTQAARGTLELTGKHLEELVMFSEQAEDQLGATSEAAAEMGEAAELGSLQAKAAFEEFKIAAGEALNVGLEPLYKNSVQFLKLWSGNYDNQVDKMTDSLIEAADGTEELVEAGQKIGGAYETATGSVIGLVASSKEMRAELKGSAQEVIQQLAEQSNSVEEFRQSLVDLGAVGAEAGTFALFSGYEFNPEEVFHTAQMEEVAYSLEQIDQKMIQVAGTTTTAIDHASAYGQSLEELAQMGRLEAQAQQDRQERAVAGARIMANVWDTTTTAATEAFGQSQEAITAALEAERQAVEAMRVEYNGYALDILNGQETESNWTNALFQTAAQAGINQGQFYELALATGEYSEAQIRAALTEAAMRQAVEELSGQLAAGKITVDDAVTALNNFEDALANDYTAELDFATFKDGETQAKNTKQALKDAEGSYTAEFTTINTTINKTINEGSTSTGGGTGSTGPGEADGSGGHTSLHRGGRFQAGEMLLVGDGPGGKFIPGLSEFVVFDQPGTVIGAKDSADLFAGQSLPPGFSTATQPVTDFVTTSTQSPTALVQFTGDIIINDKTDVDELMTMVEEKVREAMEQR